MVKKRPCCICGRWFRPNARIGARQAACSRPECQASRRRKTQARWRAKNPEYGRQWRLRARSQAAAKAEAALAESMEGAARGDRAPPATERPRPPDPLRVPPELSGLPWEYAKDEIGQQATDFIAVTATLLVRLAKDQIEPQVIGSARDPRTLPCPTVKDQIRPVPG